MFRRLAPALIAAVMLAAPAVAQAALNSAYDFPADDVFAASYAPTHGGLQIDAPVAGLNGASNATFAQGQGYTVPTTGLTPGSWSVALRFKFTQVDPNGPAPGGWLRILDFSGGSSDAGLYLHDGRLAWKNAAGALVAEGAAPLVDDTPEQIVVTRDGAILRAFREGSDTADFEVTNPDHADPTGALRLFVDEGSGTEEGAGEISRLRTFDSAIASPASLSPLDTSKPGPFDFGCRHNLCQSEVVDGSTLWIGPTGPFDMYFISGFVDDDGTGPLAVSASVSAFPGGPDLARDETGSVVTAPGDEAIETLFGFSLYSFGLTSLGAPYDLVLRATDKRGNVRSEAMTVMVDDTGPTGLTIDTADTADRTPVIGGAATAGLRDENTVWADVCKGTTCDRTPGDRVGYVRTEIVDGRWGSDRIMSYDGYDEIGDLALGEYVVAARQKDIYGNQTNVSKVFKVLASPPPGAPTEPSLVKKPPALPRPESQSPSQSSALLARNSRSIIAALRREGLRGLTRHRRADAAVSVDRPAGVYVEVWDGAATNKASDAAKKPSRHIAYGARRFAAPGTGKITVKLSKDGKRRLKGMRRRKLRVRTTLVPVGGAPISRTKTITVAR